MEAAYLLALGFVVGLSGAMMPGPLLVYTIAESMRRGWKTGFLVIVGHAAVEAALMAFILAGVGYMMTSETFVRLVSILGGVVMVHTAFGLAKSSWGKEAGRAEMRYGAVTGGILFTAFNPGLPIWWATAGARLLLEGMRSAGLFGAFLVVVGHWLADLGWYLLVSVLISRGMAVAPYVGKVRALLSLALAAIGIYYLQSGFN